MNQKTIIAAVVVFVLVVIGMFWFASTNKTDQSEQVHTEPEPSGVVVDDPYASIDRIDAKHFFIDGTHTIAGEVQMPTPCDLLDWDVALVKTLPARAALIDFTVINNAETCAQVVTPQRFLVTFDAAETAEITAQLNGRPVTLNLVPAAPGETPDDFELFIKG